MFPSSSGLHGARMVTIRECILEYRYCREVKPYEIEIITLAISPFQRFFTVDTTEFLVNDEVHNGDDFLWVLDKLVVPFGASAEGEGEERGRGGR